MLFICVSVDCYICAKHAPLQIVDSESFVDFVQTCIPGKRSLSRRTLTRRVEEKFSIEKTKLKEILQDASSVATTADLWTCRNR